MKELKIILDTIRVAVNPSDLCNKVTESNNNDVAIVFIIAVASVIALLMISLLIYFIVGMKKHEGIKTIVEDILKEKNVTPDGIKATVEKVLEDKEKQGNKNGE